MLLCIVVMYCCYVLLLCIVVMYCCYVLLVVAIDTVLLFRPLKITTADFGKKWGTLAYEKKLKLSSSTSITVAQHFMDTMSSKFNFYPVEIIGIAMLSHTMVLSLYLMQDCKHWLIVSIYIYIYIYICPLHSWLTVYIG